MPTKSWGAIVSVQCMSNVTVLILVHQLLFQGMFFAKNVSLKRKLGKPIRGFNPEANLSIAFFVGFIGMSFYFAMSREGPGTVEWLPNSTAVGIGVLLMLTNLLIGLASLQDLGDSWRVGVIEEQQTQLVDSGIYRFTRNPYFVAYLMMFAAYTVLLQNLILLALTLVGFGMVHAMILREEKYLAQTHGKAYQQYKQRVPRYILV
jgi:protein-S-isoprenylcysteine O-methyltransferase Ste14